MKALSIRQPWAWLILYAGKDIENRNWPTAFRGPCLIHAAKGMTRREYEAAMDWVLDEPGINLCVVLPEFGKLKRGGIVGEVEIVDCVQRSDSPWFTGPYGFVLRNPKPLPLREVRGMLGFFDPDKGVAA